jgi:NADPH:quinone reductase-like Zn-dependent oxidoreductase
MPLELLHVHRLRVETSDAPISDAEAAAAAEAALAAVEKAARRYETDAFGKKVLIAGAATEAQ